MASGSFNLTRTGNTSSYISFLVNWSSYSNGIDANSSTVHVAVYAQKSSLSTSNTWGTVNTNVSLTDGGALSENGLALNVAPGSSQLIFAKNFTVPHNADGKKSITISVNVGGDVVWGNGSAYVALDTIPRYASITAAPNFNDEENPTINYSNPAGNAITSLQACISLTGNVDDIKYRDIPKTGSSYTFVLTDEEREILRNATLTSNTREVIFLVASTIGGNTSRSHLRKTLTIVNAMPELTVSAKDVGAASKLLTGDENKIIKGFNYVLSSMSSKLKKGATIKSQTITNGSQSLVGEVGGTASMEGGFNNTESATFIFGLTDSRGNTVNKYLTLDMIDYVKLTCNLTVEKPTVDGVLKFNVSGNYFNDTFGAQYNYLALEYRTKKEGEDWSGWTLIDSEYTLQDNKYSVDGTITGLDYRKAYTIQVRAQDRINLIPSAEKTVKALPVYDWGKDDFQFNVDVKDKSGTIITNGLALYEDAGIDPDTTLEHLILTHLNTPCNDFMYIKTEFYGSKTATSNRMQTAYPYYTNDPPYYRYYFNGSWTEWKTQNNYSTSEQIIGTWIDGKPIYRCVFTLGLFGSNDTNISFNIEGDYKNITNSFFYISNNGITNMTIPIRPSDALHIFCWAETTSNGSILVSTSRANAAHWPDWTLYAIFEYTKTTD